MSRDGSELGFQTPKQKRFRTLVAKSISLILCFIHHIFIDILHGNANDGVVLQRSRINEGVLRAPWVL